MKNCCHIFFFLVFQVAQLMKTVTLAVAVRAASLAQAAFDLSIPVSYTHLTLPTTILV